MKKYNLFCPIRKANPYRRMAKALQTNNVADNILNREFREHGPRMVLLTDITYISYNNTRCYLSTILDAFTKELLAYVLSESLEVDFVLETVNILIEKHGISLSTQTLVHSDQGCHYTSYSFIQILKDKSLRQSMSRKGNCWDNAPQESFFGHMKDEIDVSECETFEEVKKIIDDWINYYNNDRYQWNLAKLSPSEFYKYIRPSAIFTPNAADTLQALLKHDIQNVDIFVNATHNGLSPEFLDIYVYKLDMNVGPNRNKIYFYDDQYI